MTWIKFLVNILPTTSATKLVSLSKVRESIAEAEIFIRKLDVTDRSESFILRSQDACKRGAKHKYL